MAITNVLLVAEIAACLFAAWPLVRQLTYPPFRRMHHFCKNLNRAGVLAVYITLVFFLALNRPDLLHVITVFAVAFLLFERWRALPNHGGARGLPPGSLALMQSGPTRDARYLERQFAKYGPMFKISFGLRPAICVFGNERGRRLLRDCDETLYSAPMPFNRFLPDGFLRFMLPAEHMAYRKLLQTAISVKVIDQSAPIIASIAKEVLSDMARACSNSSNGKVNPDSYIREFVLRSFLQVFFSIGCESQLFEKLCMLFETMDAHKNTCGSDRTKRRATQTLISVLREHATSSGNGESATADCFLDVLRETEPGAIDNDTALGNLIYMFDLGSNDIANLLRWVLKMLLDHPIWMERLRETTESPFEKSAEQGSLSTRIVKEVLRLEQSEYIQRRSSRDIWFDNYRIPKKWIIRICTREGNRDPAIFSRPDEFDPDRFLDRKYTQIEYAPFGLFRHNCLGADLTLSVCDTFIVGLANGFDLYSDDDWGTEFGQYHWQPSRGYKIGLRPRSRLE